MKCEELRARLEEGLSVARQQPEASAHLERCADCRDYATRLASEDELFEDALRQPAEEDDGFKRVQAGVHRKLGERRRRRWVPPRRAWSGRTAVLVAAGLLLGVSLYLIISQSLAPADSGRLAEEESTPSRPTPVDLAVHKKGVLKKAARNAHLSQPEKWRLPRNLAELKKRLRKERVLDDLAQVQVVMRSMNDTEGLEVAQNLELHLERLFTLKPKDKELCWEVLGAIRDARVPERIDGVKGRWSAPESARVARTLEVGQWALGPALEPILERLQPGEVAEGAFKEAERVLQKKDYDGALKLYRRIAEQRPKDKRAVLAEHASAFILQKKLKKPAEARKAYQRIVKNHREEPIAYTAHFHIAETFESDGFTDSAIEQYGSLLDLAPEHHRATEANRRVNVLRKKKKGEQASPAWGQVFLEKKKKSKQRRPQRKGQKQKPAGQPPHR